LSHFINKLLLLLDKAKYSAFETTVNSSIISYHIAQ